MLKSAIDDFGGNRARLFREDWCFSTVLFFIEKSQSWGGRMLTISTFRQVKDDEKAGAWLVCDISIFENIIARCNFSAIGEIFITRNEVYVDNAYPKD